VASVIVRSGCWSLQPRVRGLTGPPSDEEMNRELDRAEPAVARPEDLSRRPDLFREAFERWPGRAPRAIGGAAVTSVGAER